MSQRLNTKAVLTFISFYVLFCFAFCHRKQFTTEMSKGEFKEWFQFHRMSLVRKEPQIFEGQLRHHGQSANQLPCYLSSSHFYNWKLCASGFPWLFTS